MAKQRGGGNGSGRLKIRYIDGDRFFEAEIEGGDETLVRTVHQVGGMITGSRGRLKAVGPAQEHPVPDDDEPLVEDPIEVDAEDAPVRPDRNGPKRPPSYPKPEIVASLDPASGEISLKEYMSQHDSPSEHNSRYLVIMAWLWEQQSIKEIDINYIWTCYRAMGWNVQKDVAAPLRKMKQNGLVTSPSKSKYEINHVGLGKVNEMKQAAQS